MIRHRRRHYYPYRRYNCGGIRRRRNSWSGSEETGIFDMPTQVLFDESRIDDEQLEAMLNQAPTAIDWDQLAEAASVGMPGMRWMYRRGLSKAFSDPTVQSEFRNFLAVLMMRAERNLSGGFRRNPEELLFADTAEEALLPRQELQRRQAMRRRPPIKRKSLPPKPVQAIKTRCLSMPTQKIIKMLRSSSPIEVKQGLEYAGELCPENIDAQDWRTLTSVIEDLASRGRRNPAPALSISSLARKTLVKMRRARAKAGFDVFRRRY